MTALPDRRSIRLAHYDYAMPGGYFVTICTIDRRPMFDDPRLRQIVDNAWADIPTHHPHVEIDEFVVMPNHVHGILFFGTSAVTGARAQQAAPLQRSEPLVAPGALGVTDARAQQAAPLQRSRPRVAPGALGAVIRSFKGRVTRDVRGAMGLDIAVWQRNYHEHVIRNEQALQRIRQYIIDNPARWAFDHENPAGRPDGIERDFGDWLNQQDPHFAARVGGGV
jgi:REP element-mobilizing transposase RayT